MVETRSGNNYSNSTSSNNINNSTSDAFPGSQAGNLSPEVLQFLRVNNLTPEVLSFLQSQHLVIHTLPEPLNAFASILAVKPGEGITQKSEQTNPGTRARISEIISTCEFIHTGTREACMV